MYPGADTDHSQTTLFPALRLRRAVGLIPDLPIIDYRTQREQINATMQMERLFAALTAAFGVSRSGSGVCRHLRHHGVHGGAAHQRVGIRLALGAQPAQVRGMILRESTWLAVTGIAVGVGAAFGLTRLVKSMLYGVTPNDPVTLIAGVSLIARGCVGIRLDSCPPSRRCAAHGCAPSRVRRGIWDRKGQNNGWFYTCLSAPSHAFTNSTVRKTIAAPIPTKIPTLAPVESPVWTLALLTLAIWS